MTAVINGSVRSVVVIPLRYGIISKMFLIFNAILQNLLYTNTTNSPHRYFYSIRVDNHRLDKVDFMDPVVLDHYHLTMHQQHHQHHQRMYLINKIKNGIKC
jgi:hypothetical protein